MCAWNISRLSVVTVILIWHGPLASGQVVQPGQTFQGLQGQFGLQSSEVSPVARILETIGTVKIWDPEFNEERQATPFGTVYSNERLRVTENSSVTVVLRGTGQVERVSATGQYQVTSDGCLPRQGVESVAMPEQARATIQRVSLGQRGIVAGAVVIAQFIAPEQMPFEDQDLLWDEQSEQAIDDLVLGPLEPAFSSTVLGSDLRFSWPAKPGAQRYTVQLLRNAEILWSATTDNTSIDCVLQTPLRPASQFTWRVSCVLDGRIAVIVDSQFRTASERQKQLVAELRSMTSLADRIPLMIAAMWMQQNGFYQDAIALNERLVAMKPDASIYEQLVDLYWEINDDAKADAAQKRAEELRRPSRSVQP